METGVFIFVAIVVVLIFLALRDLLLWYWKVNRKIEIQEKTLETLLFIFEELKKNNKPIQIKTEERLKL